MYQQPGPTPNYRQDNSTFAPDQSQTYNDGDVKTQGVRFKPKSRINDPIFLVIFVLQVCLLSFQNSFRQRERVFLVSRIHRLVWHSLVYMDITRRSRGRPWCGWRSIWHSSDIEQVLTFFKLSLSRSNISVKEHRLSTSSDYGGGGVPFSPLSHLDSHVHQDHYAHHPGSYDFA